MDNKQHKYIIYIYGLLYYNYNIYIIDNKIYIDIYIL